MRITAAKVIVCCPGRNFITLKIDTDAGIYGLGELEHKTVAYDLHVQVSEHPYIERLLSGPLVLGALVPGIVFSLGWMVAKQGEGKSWKKHLDGLAIALSPGGIIYNVFSHLPAYFAPGFHPSQRDTKNLEAVWHDKLFGDQGEINEWFSNRSAVASAKQ